MKEQITMTKTETAKAFSAALEARDFPGIFIVLLFP
jgi:hypothetical protein